MENVVNYSNKTKIDLPRVCFRLDLLARVAEVGRAGFIIHDFHRHSLPSPTRSDRQLLQSITDESRSSRRRPRAGDQNNFFLGSDDEVGHVSENVGQGSDDCQRHRAIAAHQRRRHHTAHGIGIEAGQCIIPHPEKVVAGLGRSPSSTPARSFQVYSRSNRPIEVVDIV